MGHPESEIKVPPPVEPIKMEDDDRPPSYYDSSTVLGDSEKKRAEMLQLATTINFNSSTSLFIKKVVREKLWVWKNILSISMSFMCLFVAFGTVSSLQSTINSDGGLGTIAMSSLYISQILSSLFVSTWLMQWIDLKWTMVLCQLCYVVFIVAQFYPVSYILIPGAVIAGFGAAPMWSAQGVYFSRSGESYAELIGNKSWTESQITRFFAAFFIIVATSVVWGNLISSAVLASPSTKNATVITEERLSYCGAQFCIQDWNNYINNGTGENETQVVTRPDNINTLLGILLGFAVLAPIVMTILVDSPPKTKDEKKSGWKSLTATLRHLKNPYQLLMIPLTLWPGFESTFLMADVTYGFITCAWGVEYIGIVLICYGIAAGIGAILCGALVKRIGRIPIFLFGATGNICLLFTMLFFWQPSPSHTEVFFIFAAFGGLSDSVWLTQLNAFYGVIFHEEKEAAFSNFRLFQSLGFAIAFGYSNYLCIYVKLYILACVLLAGMAGYLTVEVMEHRRKSKQTKIDHDDVISTKL